MRTGTELAIALTMTLGVAAQELEKAPDRALRLLPVGQAPGTKVTLLVYPPTLEKNGSIEPRG